MFIAHVEATFESAHRNGPQGHKCAGTIIGVPASVDSKVRDFFGTAGIDGELANDLLVLLANEFDFHGHSWLAEIDFAYDESKLDDSAWGPDFGAAKALIRDLDHHNLNLLMDQPSAEVIASYLYQGFSARFGFDPLRVIVHEGRGNRMEYSDD